MNKISLQIRIWEMDICLQILTVQEVPHVRKMGVSKFQIVAKMATKNSSFMLLLHYTIIGQQLLPHIQSPQVFCPENYGIFISLSVLSHVDGCPPYFRFLFISSLFFFYFSTYIYDKVRCLMAD